MVKPHSSSKSKVWIRALLSAVAFGVVLYLFWPLIGELRNILDLLKHAQWAELGLAVSIQFISYSFLTMLNQLLLSPFSGKIGFWRLMAILTSMAFIEVALPSAGLSGVVLRARLLGKDGYSAEASSFTLLMETIYVGGVMVVVSFAGIWYLLESGGIRLSQLVVLTIITVLLIVGSFMFYRLGQEKQRGMRWAGWILTRWNQMRRILHRPEIPMESLNERLDRFYEGLAGLKRVNSIALLACAFARIALDIATLWLCFLAFHFAISLGILLTGYGLVLSFSGLAALPGGLGLVDISLAAIYARLGAPGAVAVAAALSYRLIAFWLIRFIGFVSWQVLEART
ncbi:MAG TPA: flippase-like domain-containing protein [Anaerolineales bacterium]|nr:flippase-like domain-containing protein [Anaerolineales bacterium]